MSTTRATIRKMLTPGETAIFCGAGISLNSGIPVVRQFNEYLFSKLGMDAQSASAVMSSNLPFEGLVEILQIYTDISPILEIFSLGRPNPTHILISKLARRGIVRTICTTNFDMHIETALNESRVAYRKYFNEIHFEQHAGMDGNPDGAVELFKLHGSAEEEFSSIRIVLSQIANQRLSSYREKIVQHLMMGGSHKRVLVLGYSFSDVFDITPQMEAIKRNRKEVVYIKHKGRFASVVHNRNVKRALRRYPHEVIECDTDSFVRDMWLACGNHPLPNVRTPLKGTEWHRYIDVWIAKAEAREGSGIGSLIAGRILGRICKARAAIPYFKKALTGSHTLKNANVRGECLLGLGLSIGHAGDISSEIAYMQKAIEQFKDAGDITGLARCYMNLGTAYGKLKCNDTATQYITKSVQTTGDVGIKAPFYNNLGILLRCSRRNEEAVRYHLLALEASQVLGDKHGEAVSCANLAAAYIATGDTPKAIDYCEKTIEVANNIGDASLEASGHTMLGCIFTRIGAIPRALQCFSVAEGILLFNGQDDMLRDVFRSTAGAHLRARNLIRALKYYIKAAVFIQFRLTRDE